MVDSFNSLSVSDRFHELGLLVFGCVVLKGLLQGLDALSYCIEFVLVC